MRQQKKDQIRENFTELTSLEVFERRWGSIASDSIVKRQRSKSGCDSITTYVDRLSRIVHFPSKDSETDVDFANAFFCNIF